MNTNLSKKEKKFLIIAALLMGTAWFIPVIVRKTKIELEEKTISREIRSGATKAAYEYLKNLSGQPNEIIGETIGVKETISDYEIVGLSGNKTNATVIGKIQLVNSYALPKISLQNQEGKWKVTEIEKPEFLYYEQEGIRIRHNPRWMATYREGPEGDTKFWVLEERTKEHEILFTVRKVPFEQTEYGPLLLNCSEGKVKDCRNIESKGGIIRAAYYTAEQIQIYALEKNGRSIMVMTRAILEEPEIENEIIWTMSNIEFL